MTHPARCRPLGAVGRVFWLGIHLGCGGGDVAAPGDQTGAIQVVTSISGEGVDVDGYTIRIDNAASHTVAARDTLMVEPIAVGTHTVALTDLAQNCTETQSLSSTVNVTAGAVARASFAAVCEPPVTAITVVVTTVGLDPDPDGYSFALDGGVAENVAPLDTLFYEDVSPGDHSISVEGLAPNCSVESGSPATVHATAGATVRITTTIRCTVPGLILFGTIEEGWGSDLWVVNGDGSGLRRLTNDVSSDHCHRWVPGGRILFVSDRQGGGIFTMNADGTDLRQVFQGYVEPCPLWSPDASKYVYTLGKEDETHVYLVDADGSSPRLLTRAATGNVSWVPDGTRLVFVATDQSIYSINVDGSGLQLLVDPEGFPGSVHWSPDGRTLAFSVARRPGSNEEEVDLYFMDPDGTHLRLVGKGFPYAWSAQGDRLLTVNAFPGWTGRIFLADGSDQGDIGPVWDIELSWAPSGRALVFTGPYNPGSFTHEEIWVMNPDGSGRAPITNLNVFGVVGPQWGP